MADIDAMKQNVADALGVDVATLPPDLGQMWDFNGDLVRWPIPQTVMVNWLASVVSADGSIIKLLQEPSLD